MTKPDPILTSLSRLPLVEPDAALSARLRARAIARLRPRPLRAVWAGAIALGVVVYLGWALEFSSSLY